MTKSTIVDGNRIGKKCACLFVFYFFRYLPGVVVVVVLLIATKGKYQPSKIGGTTTNGSNNDYGMGQNRGSFFFPSSFLQHLSLLLIILLLNCHTEEDGGEDGSVGDSEG